MHHAANEDPTQNFKLDEVALRTGTARDNSLSIQTVCPNFISRPVDTRGWGSKRSGSGEVSWLR
jgi:hypothetical protein